MSENIGEGGVTPPVDTGVPSVDAGVPSVDATIPPVEESKLPSDVSSKVEFGGLSEELQARVNEEGLLDGKYKNVDEVLNALKEIKDKHANLSRELTDAEKANLEEVNKTAEEVQLTQKRDATIEQLIPEFLKNGMVVTPEMEAQLLETGVTKAEIELGAYKMKETLAIHQGYVGGEENYNAIMSYHAENMTQEEKILFNKSINSGEHSEALIVGLQALYERNMGQGGESAPSRIRGDASVAGVKPYGSRQELFADKRYVDSAAGKRDAGAQQRYRSKLAVTPENIWK